MYLFASVILCYVGLHLSFRFWKAREKKRLAGSSRVLSTALGPVECSIRGNGPAVLVVPGCPGGYDQARLAGDLLGSPRMQLIAISRPGYLGTPLGSHHTPEAQADVYAALLDELHIRSAAVVGISGGGPSALQFALRHPDRCFALAMVSAISQRMTPKQMNYCKSVSRRILGVICLAFYLGALRVVRSPRENGSGLSDFYAGFLRSSLSMQVNRAGLENDMSQLLALPDFPLTDLVVPTLVMHGIDDSMVPYSHAEFIVRQAPAVTEISIPRGGHLFFAKNRDQLTPKIIEFFEQHTGEPGLTRDQRAGV